MAIPCISNWNPHVQVQVTHDWVTHIHGYPSTKLKAQQLARTVLIDNWFNTMTKPLMEHGHCLQMHTLYMNHRIQMSKQKPTANQIETHICKLKQPIATPQENWKAQKFGRTDLKRISNAIMNLLMMKRDHCLQMHTLWNTGSGWAN